MLWLLKALAMAQICYSVLPDSGNEVGWWHRQRQSRTFPGHSLCVQFSAVSLMLNIALALKADMFVDVAGGPLKTSPQSSKGRSSLSGGAIGGITIAGIVGLAILGTALNS